jgi:hypothetical protein
MVPLPENHDHENTQEGGQARQFYRDHLHKQTEINQTLHPITPEPTSN